MAESTVLTRLTERAIKDSTFRQKVLANPKKVLAEEYNVRPPANITVRVLEETSDTFSIVLPQREEMVQELSDEELEAVAGGAKSWEIIAWTFICYTVEDV